MITVICATHRPQNQTTKVVDTYTRILEQYGEDTQVLRMEELPRDFVFSDSFGKRTASVESLIERKIVPAERLVIISPEYNGSFPGVFKALLDGVDPRIWKGKKVALVGVSAGRAGNLRGMDHLTDILNYLRMEVFSLKVPISRLDSLLSEEGMLNDRDTEAVLAEQAREFLEF